MLTTSFPSSSFFAGCCIIIMGGNALISAIQGRRSKVEIIEYRRDWEGKISQDFPSHFFDNVVNVFENVWQICDNTLNIWGWICGFSGEFWRINQN